ENAAYAIKTTDFGFTDPNDSPQNILKAVQITLLPYSGTLTDNGIAVTANQFVSASDISGGNLVYTPQANLSGGPYFLCKFRVQDDGGTANGGVDLDSTGKALYIAITHVNQTPVGTTGTVTMSKNTVYAFKTTDFGFTDPH